MLNGKRITLLEVEESLTLEPVIRGAFFEREEAWS